MSLEDKLNSRESRQYLEGLGKKWQSVDEYIRHQQHLNYARQYIAQHGKKAKYTKRIYHGKYG